MLKVMFHTVRPITKDSSQTGFSIIEALLILVVVGILGFTGWYVYHVKQAANRNYSTANSSTVPTYKKKTSTNAATTQGTYLDFKEAGVKILLGSSVKDAVYAPYATASTDGATVYGISTLTVDNAGGDKFCSAQWGELGILRVTTTPPKRLGPGVDQVSTMKPDNKSLFLIGGKYYQYVGPQNAGTCGSLSPYQVAAYQQAMRQSFTTLQSDSSTQ